MSGWLRKARDAVQRLRLPQAARDIARRDRAALPLQDAGASRVIEAGIAWLLRAQDHSTSRDGGVARHYSLIDGWAASYPETTGYIVTTFLTHAERSGNRQLADRAARMLDFLVSIQFDEGGFQGGTIGQLPRVPVTFNTGQILIGLAAGAMRDPKYLAPMRRAADWLVASQDQDGCWRQHPTPFAAPGEKTYETHVAFGLIEAAKVDATRGYVEAAVRQVDWALTQQQPNGWLAKCCLSDPDRPLTHTLGYALRGILAAYDATKEQRFLDAARRTADGLIGAMGGEGRLPGRLDAAWRPAAAWVCLTGSSQIAECWLRLYGITGEKRYRDAGLAANRFVRRTIVIDGPPEISGGVKGAFPVDSPYGAWQYLNWACKFTIDANVLEMNLGV